MRTLIDGDEFRSAPSDKRVGLLFGSLQTRAKDWPRDAWSNPEGKVLVHCIRSAKAMTLSIDEKLEPGFGEFLFRNLENLYASFRQSKPEAD